MNDILKKYFGYDKLKDKQEEIINNILDKRDTIGILATGYGKSICYQLPFLITKKSVLVISPLISLMEDQYNKLKNLKINVYCLNSNNSKKYTDKNDILNGENGIIYMSPEYFKSSKDFLIELSNQNRISLVAIDESHCISTWSDFRPEYRNLYCVKEWINAPILALTASATPKMIDDIKNLLKLENSKLVISSFYRSNLDINIIKKFNFEIDFKEIYNLLQKLEDGDRAIIYCKTKNETDEFVDKLNKLNVIAKSYHAGKSNKSRNLIQSKFMKGDVNIIIATIAFGMGIDVPNIRLVINYGISKDMESFYQEFGRAGRDGKNSRIYLYWSNYDFSINKHFLNDISDDNFKRRQMNRILEMEKFVNSNECRMKYISNYFGEEIIDCGHCDYCLSDNLEEKIDITNECYFIMKTIKKLRNNYGTGMICDILYGSNCKKINCDIRKMSVFGKLDKLKKENIKENIRFLIINDYLKEEKLQNSFGSIIKLSNKGLLWIKKNNKIENIEDKIFNLVKVKKEKTTNKKLEQDLISYRKKKASEENLKLYQVFPNNTIEELLKIRIEKIDDFLKVNGLGSKRIEKYGYDLLKIIKNNPLEDSNTQKVIDKLLVAGLSLSEISELKKDLININL
tara:strand:- start:611 stop:2494 length:1884 start_codon:yes stop_codon:yes gene_type:complete